MVSIGRGVGFTPTTEYGLGALRELDLESFHLLRGLARPSRRQRAVRVAYAVFGVPICMMMSQPPSLWYGERPPSPRIHIAAGFGSPARKRANRGLRDRAEAHAADVHDRFRFKRLAAIAGADEEDEEQDRSDAIRDDVHDLPGATPIRLGG